jgi:hypothetical protein
MRQLWQNTFALPCLLGGLSLLGLVAALLGDGAADALAWAALSSPVLAVAAAYARPRKTVRTSRQDPALVSRLP